MHPVVKTNVTHHAEIYNIISCKPGASQAPARASQVRNKTREPRETPHVTTNIYVHKYALIVHVRHKNDRR